MYKRLLLIGLCILIGVVWTAAAQSEEEPVDESYRASLPVLARAPEIESQNWLNSDEPLRLANLRGEVVLLEFWTYACINCIRTLPYVEEWHQTYKDQGLNVIGIHYPELSFERDLQNIAAATVDLNVTYPIGLDNDGATWRSYAQRFWPTIYLIDKRGDIRYVRIGEGRYEQTEQVIKDLLAETYEPEVTEQIALHYLTPDEALNVRSGAGTEHNQIGVISLGMSFMILGEQDGWYEISYNDGTGYVSGDYVTVTEDTEASYGQTN